jgi:hypothetical protein
MTSAKQPLAVHRCDLAPAASRSKQNKDGIRSTLRWALVRVLDLHAVSDFGCDDCAVSGPSEMQRTIHSHPAHLKKVHMQT